MAVPKKKTSNSKKGMRKSHNKLKNINFFLNYSKNHPKLQHHLTIKNYSYKNNKII